MRHLTDYKGDISKLRGWHILYNDVHYFAASSDTAIREANAIDDALDAQGIDPLDPKYGYIIGVCSLKCQHRP